MSVSVNNRINVALGNKSCTIADMTFDSSYPFGGEDISLMNLFGFYQADSMMIEPKDGYKFVYDSTTGKVKAYIQAPLIVYDEKVDIDSTTNQGTLKYPPAFIMNVSKPAVTVKLRSPGLTTTTLGSNEASFTGQFTKGERATITVDNTDMVSNGTFTGNANGWTLGGSGVWAYSSNTVVKSGNGTDTLSQSTVTGKAGCSYLVTYTTSAHTVGTVTPSIGGVSGTAVSAAGTYSEIITATGTGALTFTPTNTSRFTIDNVSCVCLTAYVTYVTQAWKDIWDNLVQDEVVTLSSSAAVSLAYTPFAVMYVDQTTATAAGLTIIDEDDTAASGEIGVKFGASTGQILTSHADNNAKACKVTYLKLPSSGFLKERFISNETGAGSGSDPYLSTFDYPILLWSYTGCMPVNGGVTQKLIDFASTPVAGYGVLDWYAKGTRGGGAVATGTAVGTKSNVTGTGAYIWGSVDEIPCPQNLEVPDGTDLSGITTKIIIIGA